MQVFPEIAPITENNMVYEFKLSTQLGHVAEKVQVGIKPKIPKVYFEIPTGTPLTKNTNNPSDAFSMCVCLTERPKNKCWN